MGKNKYTLQSVIDFLQKNDNNHECTLLSSKYISTKSQLKFTCNICGEEFTRTFETLRNSKYYCCGKCAKKRSGGKHDAITLQDVQNYLNEYDINKECTLLSTEYVNSISPLLLHCNICGKDFSRDFSKIKQKRFCCPDCGQKAGATSKVYTTEYVQQYIQEHSGYTLLEEYQGSHHPTRCQCARGHEFNLWFSDYLNRGRGCKECAIIDHSGENHWNWQDGGHQEVMDALRHAIIPWKKDCLSKAQYRCDIDGIQSSDLVVHHANINFSSLVKEACNNLNLELYNQIADYTMEERQSLETELLKLHYDKAVGIVMQRKYHDEFHSLYGKINNTLKQYNEYKINKK